MDKQLEDYYKARFEMFSEQGWRDLIEDIDSMIKSTDTLSGIDDEKKLNFRKGELSILNWLKGLEAMSEAAFKELKESQEE